MTIKSKAKNLFYRASEDLGNVLGHGFGVLGGAIDGTINASLAPTFIRRELGQESYQVGLRSPLLRVYKTIAPFVSRNYQNRPIVDESSIDSEIERRCLDYENAPVENEQNRKMMGSHIYAEYATEALTRWGSLLAAANDVSDGSVDNFGWMMVPMAASLVYETARCLINRKKSSSITRTIQTKS